MVRFVGARPRLAAPYGLRLAGGVNPCTFFASGNGSLQAQDRSGPFSLTASGALRYQAANGARTNLVKNPSFETDTSFWSARGSGTSITRDTTEFNKGLASLKVTMGGTTNGPDWGAAAAYTDTPVTPGSAYTFSAMFKCAPSVVANVRIGWRDATGSSTGVVSDSPATNGTGTWLSLVATGTAPNNAAYAVLILGVQTANGVVNFDAVQFEQGSSATPYFDGVAGGVWLDPVTGQLGTAHASPSVSQAAFWVEEGTTNVVPDPIFGNATITTNWAVANVSGSAAIARDTTFNYYGQASGKVTCGASSGDGLLVNSGLGATAATGQTWTVQARVRANTSGDVGKTVRLGISERDSSNALVLENFGPSITLADAWKLATYTVTLSGGATTAKVLAKVYNNANVAVTFNVDGVQLEQKAYATSLCAGSLGTGYSWAGSANASSSTRASTKVSADETNRIRSDQGAAAVFYDAPNGAGASGGNAAFISLGLVLTAGKDHFQLRAGGAGVTLQSLWEAGTAAQTTATKTGIAGSVWHLGYADWQALLQRVSVDGGTFATGSRDPITGDISTTSDMTFGCYASGGAVINGLMGPIAIYSRPLTDTELAKVIALGPSLAFTSIQS